MTDDTEQRVGDVPTHLVNPRRWALLTGAGFSANWGFPVAQEVWAFLVSDPEIQGNDAVRRSLLGAGSFNYESALARAQAGEFGNDGRRVLEAAIGRVFDGIQTRLNNDDIGLQNEAMCGFLSCFCARSTDETGLIFTLNQDMLLEASAGIGHTDGGAVRPGAEKPFKLDAVLRVNYGVRRPKLGAEPNVRMRVDSLKNLPGGQLAVPAGNTYYLKLHGSWDWVGPDREIGMVMGGRKAATILESPLLSFYQEVFRGFLAAGDRKLLIIGYGFADPHINLWIAKAVRYHGLRIYIWDRRAPSEIHKTLMANSPGIWEGLCGYSQASLRELLTLRESGSFSAEARRHFKSIFGGEAPTL